MTESVWCANIFSQEGLFAAYNGAGNTEEDRKWRIKASARNRAGRVLAASDFPARLHAMDDPPPVPNDYAHISGRFPMVSPRMAELLDELDLGDGGFFSTRFCDKSGTQELPYRHRFWNLGNTKTTFLPEQSRNVKRITAGAGREIPEMYDTTAAYGDGDVAVSRVALAGPDVWVEPRAPDLVFFSGRFERHVTETRIEELFPLRSVRVL